MGSDKKTPWKLKFDPKVRLEFRGATLTSDAGLLACRELDDALGLSDFADDYLKDSRTGNNIRHKLIPLVRQSIYSRLAGYDDTNDADRLSQDPAMRVVVGWKGADRNAATAAICSPRQSTPSPRCPAAPPQTPVPPGSAPDCTATA